MAKGNGNNALTQLGFDFGEQAKEPESEPDDPARIGFLETMEKMNALLERIPSCPRKTEIRQILEGYNAQGPDTDWEKLNKDVKGLYWGLCFPFHHSLVAGFEELLPVFSNKSIRRLQRLIWNLEKRDKRGELDTDIAFQFRSLHRKAQEWLREPTSKTPLWDWHRLLWAVEDLFQEVAGAKPEGEEEEPRIFGVAEKQRLTDLLAELGENMERMTPELARDFERIQRRFNAVEAAPGTESMWSILLDSVEVFFEEFSSSFCDLKNQTWGMPGEWFVVLKDGHRIKVTYKPCRYSFKDQGATDNFEFRGEISETGYRSDYVFRDPDTDLIELSLKRAEEFRAKFKKEFSQSAIITSLRRELKTKEAIHTSWDAKFEAQGNVIREVREQTGGLLIEQFEILRLLREESGMEEEDLLNLENAMRKRFPDWSLNRKS